MTFRPALDLEQHRAALLTILQAVAADATLTGQRLDRLVRQTGRTAGGRIFSRDDLLRAYRAFAGEALPPFDPAVIERLRMKPVRTSSGVTPVTILTRPYPCPGECIFCPNDVRMPKSYLSDEPGAQRAAQNAFDPYLQTMTRLRAFFNTGHPTDKIELLILGGTWSFYPESYQIWFVRRAFDALHDFGRGEDRSAEVWQAIHEQSPFDPAQPAPNVRLQGAALHESYNQTVQRLYASERQQAARLAAQLAAGGARRPTDEFATWQELEAAHRENEAAAVRCVGLVIETRPDYLTAEETLRLRRLGATKVQIGFQSLDDRILRLNRRGHTTQATREAVALLRAAGFKIHAHWMPNLYGATPDSDRDDYDRLFADPAYRPDELKIYPCSLIESAELMRPYQEGRWRPYTHDELLELLMACFRRTPEYCRLTRVIRDIPGTDIVDGNRTTNFRQLVEQALAARGEKSADIRAREVRFRLVDMDELRLETTLYEAAGGREAFLQFIAPDRSIAAFLRLRLPAPEAAPLCAELAGAAIIREVHVYGQAVEIGGSQPGRAQHSGLGARLIEHAALLAAEAGCARLSVISAVGTRAYYRRRGFSDGALYQHRLLAGSSDQAACGNMFSARVEQPEEKEW
jgi:elongator complex protein 3